MKAENLKPWFFAAWVVAVGVAAMALGVTSLTHWIVAGVVAIVPAAVTRILWRVPERSLSESIHDARQ
jgi:hypothetical protein